MILERENRQLIRIQPCIQKGMVFVVPHGRRRRDTTAQEEIHRRRLRDGLDTNLMLIEYATRWNVEIPTP